MADNFLERRAEELKSGGQTVIRRVNPSLDTLLGRVHDKTVTDGAYLVRKAQLEAMIRSASMLGVPFKAEISDDQCTVRLEPEDDMMLMGTVILAMQLKAAELGLKTEVRQAGCIEIKVFK